MTPCTIQEGVFAGCTVYIDSFLPIDTMAFIQGNTVITGNIKTGKVTIMTKEQHEQARRELGWPIPQRGR